MGVDRSKPYLVRIREYPDLGNWQAEWDELTGSWAVCGFLYQEAQLEFLEVIEPEPTGPQCVCDMTYLMLRGCDCGALTQRYRVPR